MLRTREKILVDIKNRKELREIYSHWKDYEQEEFLDFCTGVKGIKMTYDTFFKEIFNPELSPERLSDFLSEILEQKVKILHVLPNDTTRIADENALLITDIVVELENGSIANVEIQKIGYMFPGERAACYSADLLLRQYRRLRDKKKKKFTYKDIKPVYVVVLFEKSPEEFGQFTSDYIHYVKPQSNTGIRVNLLQEYYFVSLDNFKEKMQNEGITNKLEAWLTFLCTDDPEDIVKLILKYPEFKSLYEDAYQLCLNVEKVMGMFSQELRMLDVNTTQFMIDTMQEKMEKLQEKEAELRDLLEEKNREKTKLQGVLDDLQTKLAEQDEEKTELQGVLDDLQTKLAEQDEEKTELQGKCNEQADLILQLQTKLQEAGIE